jgi:hypothetical protein
VTSETYYWAGGRKVRLEPVAEAPGPLAEGAPDAPVFRAEDGSLVAVLPEVRVECADPAVLDAVVASLDDTLVVDRSEERLVLAPGSGRGEDALALANTLAETFDLDVAQARFRRVVPRPGVEPDQPG